MMTTAPLECERCRRLEELLWEMHKHLFPGEYGLGEDMLPDDEAWQAVGEILEAALEVLRR
jgi:hypothetical protein